MSVQDCIDRGYHYCPNCDCLYDAQAVKDILKLRAENANLLQTNARLKVENNRLCEARRDAERLIRRGIRAAERETWEVGQTQAEWIEEASQFVGVEKLHREIDRSTEMEGGRR